MLTLDHTASKLSACSPKPEENALAYIAVVNLPFEKMEFMLDNGFSLSAYNFSTFY